MREKMNQKMAIYKDLMETLTPTIFYLKTHEDYSFRHRNCLYLRNTITNDTMNVIWRKTSLEVTPIKVKIINIYFII